MLGEHLAEEVRDLAAIEIRCDASGAEQRADLGGEHDAVGREVVVERPRPEAVPGAEQLPIGRRPDRDREVAEQAFRAVLAPALERPQDELGRRGVRRGVELRQQIAAVLQMVASTQEFQRS